MELGSNRRIRVLYSFPNRMGIRGVSISNAAWHQVNGLAAAGADVLVYPGALSRPLPVGVRVCPTLARGKVRIPYRLLHRRAFSLHDWIVARRLEKLAGQVDIIHTWPSGSLRTIRVAARLGIPTALERPSAHTRTVYEAVQKECKTLGVRLPANHMYAYNEGVLRIEEEEFKQASYLLCPSDFVVKTFLDQGFPPEKLVRHQRGFDEKLFYPSVKAREAKRGLTMLFVGLCVALKGLHYALEAWLQSPAHLDGTFMIAGEFLPEYRDKLAPMLAQPSVRVLGRRNDVPDLMRKSDILVLPSISEGYGLVIAEAMGSGCVPLASDACTEVCARIDTGLVHHVGDVKTLTEQITRLYRDRALLERLKTAALNTARENTWTAAGTRLLEVYREILARKGRNEDLANRKGRLVS